MSFSGFSIKHMFATPFVTASFAPEVAARINAELAPFILEREKKFPSARASNMGGWQSDHNLPEWGGPAVAEILEALRELVDHVTLHQTEEGFERVAIGWKINGWANVNWKGDINVMHSHPGAFWSAVYYVQEGGGEGGELEVLDPRGPLPIVYCPLLRFGIQGYTTAGGGEDHQPLPGQCVLFPSWLQHAVKPMTGEGARISLAFNFSV